MSEHIFGGQNLDPVPVLVYDSSDGTNPVFGLTGCGKVGINVVADTGTTAANVILRTAQSAAALDAGRGDEAITVALVANDEVAAAENVAGPNCGKIAVSTPIIAGRLRVYLHRIRI